MPDLAAADSEVCARHAAEVDELPRFPLESVTALVQAGLMGLCIPTAQGGARQGPRTFAAVMETLAQACGSSAMVYVMHVTSAQAITSSMTLGTRNELLEAIARGEHLTTLAFSEKGSRSNFWMPSSRLEASGPGRPGIDLVPADSRARRLGRRGSSRRRRRGRRPR
jgi:alkylation response protein AidB-like acyl-CoA dehydrogenase